MIYPLVSKIYKKTYESILALVDFTRRFYTGDLNTYAMWAVISLLFLFYIFVKGVL